jgi:hypothetical protein
MMRRLTAVAASVGVLLTGSLARAQAHDGFGRQGQFILSADRLVPVFSFVHTSRDEFTPPVGASKLVTTNNQTAISLLWGSRSSVADSDPAGAAARMFFTVPRVGFDYVIVPNVTIGGDIVLFFTLGGSAGSETTFNNGTTTTTSVDDPSSLIFGVAPRGGYILELSNLFSLWLRGGFSYYVASTKTTNGNQTVSNSQNQFALDLDPQFVITPVPHFGITAGLTADIPLTGGHGTETDRPGVSTSSSAAASVLFIGVTAGLLGYF